MYPYEMGGFFFFFSYKACVFNTNKQHSDFSYSLNVFNDEQLLNNYFKIRLNI